MSVCPLEPFKPNSGVDFEEWEERLSMYFVSQGITDAQKQRATLLTYLSPECYTLVKNLLHPAKPTEETLENIVTKLKDHLLPPTNPTKLKLKLQWQDVFMCVEILRVENVRIGARNRCWRQSKLWK